MKKQITFGVIVLCWHIAGASSAQTSEDIDRASVTQNLTAMPLPFTKNMGQWPDSILYRADAGGATMWFTKNGIWYQFFRTVEKAGSSETTLDPSVDALDAWHGKFNHERDSIETTMIKAEFVGASQSVEVIGLEEQDYKCNYFIGNDSSNWRTDVRNYGSFTMRGLYPGVDVTFSRRNGRLQEELIASTSGDLAQVKVEFHGADSVTTPTDNIAIVHTLHGEHRFEGALLVEQIAFGSENQALPATSSASSVSLMYSTYLGGSSNDGGRGIAIDAEGNAYVTGYTYSVNFPIQNPFDASHGSNQDAFVTKLSSIGSGLIYSTYLGGSNRDGGFGIAVDSGGITYVTGYTGSTNFPTQSPFQASYGGGSGYDSSDVFVAKLNSTGNGLIYSTYLGGSDNEQGLGIAVNTGGNVCVTGVTNSANFPTKNPFQPSYGGGSGYDSSDVFVAKLNSAGNGLIYSTYLGGSDNEDGRGVAVDAGGNAYVTGMTGSANFPTQNPYQPSLGGGFASYYTDAFVTKLNSTGSGLIYSTYLGGSGSEEGNGIAVDAVGNAYVTGGTRSSNFPTQNPFQASHAPYELGSSDAFVTKLNSAGSGLVYSTYLGGNGIDRGYGITSDARGNAWVTGQVESADFPTQNPFQASIGSPGYSDAFVTKLNSTGTGLIHSTYLGGNSTEHGRGIAVDAAGSAYATGFTRSANFPTQSPFQVSLAGSDDTFVTKLSSGGCCAIRVGDANGLGAYPDEITLGDIMLLVDAKFIAASCDKIPCLTEADVNQSGGPEPTCDDITLLDIMTLVDFMFINPDTATLPECL